MIAPTMRHGLQLELVGKVASAPYIRMTMQVMKAFGVESKWENNLISIESGQRYARTLSSHCGGTEKMAQTRPTPSNAIGPQLRIGTKLLLFIPTKLRESYLED